MFSKPKRDRNSWIEWRFDSPVASLTFGSQEGTSSHQS
jgi:hypothetical protein